MEKSKSHFDRVGQWDLAVLMDCFNAAAKSLLEVTTMPGPTYAIHAPSILEAVLDSQSQNGLLCALASHLWPSVARLREPGPRRSTSGSQNDGDFVRRWCQAQRLLTAAGARWRAAATPDFRFQRGHPYC